MVLSPLVGMALAALLLGAIKLVFRRTGADRTERGFRYGQLASSAAVSLGHGTNDAQKTMGVSAALLVATGYLEAGGEELTIPLWVVLAAHSAIALGTLSGGWRIVRTMGHRITELRPARGFAAETAAAVALFGSTAVGAPVSTTQTVAGSVTGVGVADRETTVNWGVFGQMALCWVITIPTAALAAGAIYQVTQISNHLLAGVVLGLLGAFAVAVLAVGVRKTLRAADLAPETPSRPERQPVAG